MPNSDPDGARGLGTIVSNTGPLIALAGLGRLDILRTLFQAVLVPAQVHEEVLAGGACGIGLEAYRESDWLEVLPVSLESEPLLATVLDEGEAAVIVVARERKADRVLIDERKARVVARSVYRLEVMGTARLLVEAKRAGLIDSAGDALVQLRERGYWIHDDILRRAIAEAGEEG